MKCTNVFLLLSRSCKLGCVLSNTQQAKEQRRNILPNERREQRRLRERRGEGGEEGEIVFILFFFH
jgi:hypothetical protein